MQEKGHISVHTEKIFPIIKKFLYSHNDIFLRELVANAMDATQKLIHLNTIGKYNKPLQNPSIQVKVNKTLKTITISDQGVGMNAAEVKKYINQIAFSGATEFLEKYEKIKDNSQQGLIGFFGLGFYSAFMVADKVEIITKSYQENSTPIRWTCKGNTEFEITPTIKKEVGTDVVLLLNKDSASFLEEERIKNVLEKYCKFLPIPIHYEGKQINNTNPLWTKSPTKLKDEDYLDFYRELYPANGFQEPTFWIHLNVDYPFNLTGILYFPNLEALQMQDTPQFIKLYVKQVFITDNINQITPKFLEHLQGVIDSPDIPLNVSRSELQEDANVRKINTHIIKKIVDKIGETYQKDRANYEQVWEKIKLIIQYGILSDYSFYQKIKPYVLLKSTNGKYYTLEEYQKFITENQTNKEKKQVVLYSTDPIKDNTYIELCKKKGYDVISMTGPLGLHVIHFLERESANLVWKQVAENTLARLIEKETNDLKPLISAEEGVKIQKMFEKNITNEKVTFQVEPLAENLPLILVDETFKAKQFLLQSNPKLLEQDSFRGKAIINSTHQVIKKLLEIKGEKEIALFIQQIYDLTLLSKDMLKKEALTNFLDRSLKVLEQYKFV